MPLDPHAKRFLDRLAASSPRDPGSMKVEARRAALDELLGFAGRRESVAAVEDCTIPGPAVSLELRLYTPEAEGAAPVAARIAAPLPGLVYFHGGGFVAGTLDSHDAICRSLANASGHKLVSVGYRLAPEWPFPAAVEDACAAMEWVSAHAGELGIDPARLGICGDSAGATLAAVVCQWAGTRGGPRLAVQLLLCPILDYGADTPSKRELAEGYFLEPGTLRHDLMHYLGEQGSLDDPRVSPLRGAHFERLPPTCIHTAEFDPLRDEGKAYAERLQQAGVRTSYHCHPGMIHLFYGLGALIPYSQAAYRQIGTDLRAITAPGYPED